MGDIIRYKKWEMKAWREAEIKKMTWMIVRGSCLEYHVDEAEVSIIVIESHMKSVLHSCSYPLIFMFHILGPTGHPQVTLISIYTRVYINAHSFYLRLWVNSFI